MKSVRSARRLAAGVAASFVAIAVAIAVAVMMMRPWRARDAASAPPPASQAPAATASSAGSAHLRHGRFEDLIVGSTPGTPTSFVMLLSGADARTARLAALAQVLVAHGALVVTIDLPKLEQNLAADGDRCVFPDGDLENLSHFVQAYYRLPTYLSPILVGDGEGAAFAYAMLAQAPANTFAGALSMNFRPTLSLRKPLCKGSGVQFRVRGAAAGVELRPARKLQGKWIVLQNPAARDYPLAAARAFVAAIPGAELLNVAGEAHAASPEAGMPEFAAAFARLTPSVQAGAPTAPAVLGDLPVIEMPAQGGASSEFAIILSGDGGWAGLDKDVAGALVARGIPVVGLDSLRYFWSPRTPQGLASDLDRMIRYYLPRLGKRRVLLIGYSQGADVLPFAVNRLPAPARATVALAAVIGMSAHAIFEFHVTNWLTDDASGPATQPEISRIAGLPVLCIYGKDEDDSVCPRLDPTKVHVVEMPGGHHFDGNYAGLAQKILTYAQPGD